MELREKCPNTEFFWSLFSHIRTEYGELLSISPYSVRMRENTDQKNFCIWTLFTQCSTVHILEPYKMSMLHTIFRLEDIFWSFLVKLFLKFHRSLMTGWKHIFKIESLFVGTFLALQEIFE